MVSVSPFYSNSHEYACPIRPQCTGRRGMLGKAFAESRLVSRLSAAPADLQCLGRTSSGRDRLLCSIQLLRMLASSSESARSCTPARSAGLHSVRRPHLLGMVRCTGIRTRLPGLHICRTHDAIPPTCCLSPQNSLGFKLHHIYEWLSCDQRTPLFRRCAHLGVHT